MPDVSIHGGRETSRFYGADKSAADIAKAQSTDRLTDTSRLGALGKKGRGPMPKQADYASTAAFATALRKWREDAGPEVEGQRAALRKLGAK